MTGGMENFDLDTASLLLPVVRITSAHQRDVALGGCGVLFVKYV